MNSFNLKLLELIQNGRKSGLTFAPESGSQRMRDIINKNIKEDEMLDCIRMAFGKGWERAKLYFMIGLPFENRQDIVQIVELIEKIIMAAKEKLGGKKFSRLNINISINVFCPKPFTPFQWVGLDKPEILYDKFNYILNNAPKRYVDIKWADPNRGMVECALSTGNQLVGDVIENGWRKGAKFDNWSF
ncbi:MAG: hypothetical protein A2Z35_05105 [Actinobacteria bacterium RBG_19FT_COMBO_36_27]|nr:MAG: hypothetical protein A2Z35_05105 [Actinobacteria bacterium RBG_19FT_COMBO_36_27]